MKRFSTKKLCRAGIIAALYVVLTWPLGSLAFGTLGFQIRPAEALTMLPFFYVESIPALYVGCLLANVITGNAWDIGLGSLCSLVAAALTWLAGRFQKHPLKAHRRRNFPRFGECVRNTLRAHSGRKRLRWLLVHVRIPRAHAGGLGVRTGRAPLFRHRRAAQKGRFRLLRQPHRSAARKRTEQSARQGSRA